MKTLIEWLEGDIARTRKFILLITIFIFLIVTIGIFSAILFGVAISEIVTGLYGTLVGLMVRVYSFYTSTSPKSKILDKVDELLKPYEER